jgi:hypothetical protein
VQEAHGNLLDPTGYFLGHEVIVELEKRLSLREIALLDSAEPNSRPILEQMADRGG